MRNPTPLPDSLDRSFTTSAAQADGVGYGRLRGGDLARPFHGVRERFPALTLLERCQSYATRMADDEFFCAVTAALLHDLPLPMRIRDDPTLHVAVPNPRRGPRSRGVAGHKFVVVPAAGEVIPHEGLRISSPERSWCESGAQLTLDELVIAGDHLVGRSNGISSAARLRAVLERHPAPRTRALLHEAFSLLDPGSESPAETELRLLFVRAGVRGFRTNLKVAVPGSRGRRIDIAFPVEMVGFEYQGDHHRDAHQWRDDMTRVAELESLGWRIAFVNADDLREPELLVARARRILGPRARTSR
ncbi:endonuclease domain-containing protein [Homoserinibacter sp. GY 40078]|uniref:endonuclease domain-containing protein n=1 Tax=Homoserinibacter sp. GY 40078 TaxID=2603275 RepID=UPI0011CA054F|nr:hypothetical protein [Homoserinibacter sp. GY 40078]TXK18525.1 hypothetical protein FVQ89_00770 [Homoserinibacter sp. GY 40078]